MTETTAQVISARRLHTLQELAARTAAVQTAEAACALAVQSLADNRADLPFALLYLLNEAQQKLCLVGATGIIVGEAACPVEVDHRDLVGVRCLALCPSYRCGRGH